MVEEAVPLTLEPVITFGPITPRRREKAALGAGCIRTKLHEFAALKRQGS